jgi:hypothetical protein
VGRLDDCATWPAISRQSDIRQAGLAVAKRSYALFKERGYEAVILPAALRGIYHMTELVGAEMVMSTAPNIQAQLQEPGVPRELRIDRPIAKDVIERLLTIPEFVKAYEPNGMASEDFITFGPTQRTLAQFLDAGWALIEGIKLVGPTKKPQIPGFAIRRGKPRSIYSQSAKIYGLGVPGRLPCHCLLIRRVQGDGICDGAGADHRKRNRGPTPCVGDAGFCRKCTTVAVCAWQPPSPAWHRNVRVGGLAPGPDRISCGLRRSIRSYAP